MATLTLQSCDIDAALRQAAPDTNFGTQLHVISRDGDRNARGVLQFDISSLESGSTITGATLYLFVYGHESYPAAGRTYWVYRLTQYGWVENTVTWNSPWSSPGGDYTETDGANATVPEIGNWMSWNVLALVQDARDDRSDIFNVIIIDSQEDGYPGGQALYRADFYPKEEETETTLRPKLVIEYTPPPQIIYPVTIQSQEAVGSPTIEVEGIQISPVTIPSAEAVGMPALLYHQSIATATIPSAEAVGIPSIGVIGYILPVTIPSQEVVGVPTILKYVWHVILDGNYITETPETNRMFVIGRDDYGNPVWGEAHDSDESGLVGERLDFQQELAIPSSSQAAAAAEAILAKMRLTKARGVILIPPNCGQELFDVVELSDAGANQEAVKFRVVGIRFEYQPRQARYEHRLILGAP